MIGGVRRPKHSPKEMQIPMVLKTQIFRVVICGTIVCFGVAFAQQGTESTKAPTQSNAPTNRKEIAGLLSILNQDLYGLSQETLVKRATHQIQTIAIGPEWPEVWKLVQNNEDVKKLSRSDLTTLIVATEDYRSRSMSKEDIQLMTESTKTQLANRREIEKEFEKQLGVIAGMLAELTLKSAGTTIETRSQEALNATGFVLHDGKILPRHVAYPQFGFTR